MNDAERIKKVYDMYTDLEDDDIIQNLAEIKIVDGEKQFEIKNIAITDEWRELSRKAGYYANKFSRLESIYMLVLGDIADFNKTRNKLEVHENYPESNQDTNSLPRLFMHILSSGVLFVTYVENFMKEHYGKESVEAKEMKSKLSDFYDNEFVYRFMYELRNYSQHKEIPVHHITSQIIDHPKKKSKVTVEINTKSLIESGYKWKKIFKEDFTKRSPVINVSELLREYFQIISLVYGAANEIYLLKDIQKILAIKDGLDQIYKTSSQLFISEISKINLAYNPYSYVMHPYPSQYDITKLMVELSKMGLVELKLTED